MAVPPSFLGTGIDIEHMPPFPISIASDLTLPHVWDVIGAFTAGARSGPTARAREPARRGGCSRSGRRSSGSRSGPSLGLALAIVLVHVRILERALVPYVVASQTVPIVALAPIIVVGLQAGWFGVAIVASYLTFFPVTIAAIRGLRAADPRAFELMRSYAAIDGPSS